MDVKSLGSIGEGGDGQSAHIERERRGGRTRLVGGTCSGRRSEQLDQGGIIRGGRHASCMAKRIENWSDCCCCCDE